MKDIGIRQRNIKGKIRRDFDLIPFVEKLWVVEDTFWDQIDD
jgi:hypothetical protein